MPTSFSGSGELTTTWGQGIIEVVGPDSIYKTAKLNHEKIKKNFNLHFKNILHCQTVIAP